MSRPGQVYAVTKVCYLAARLQRRVYGGEPRPRSDGLDPMLICAVLDWLP
jgi:hypothetical protein